MQTLIDRSKCTGSQYHHFIVYPVSPNCWLNSKATLTFEGRKRKGNAVFAARFNMKNVKMLLYGILIKLVPFNAVI